MVLRVRLSRAALWRLVLPQRLVSELVSVRWVVRVSPKAPSTTRLNANLRRLVLTQKPLTNVPSWLRNMVVRIWIRFSLVQAWADLLPEPVWKRFSQVASSRTQALFRSPSRPQHLQVPRKPHLNLFRLHRNRLQVTSPFSVKALRTFLHCVVSPLLRHWKAPLDSYLALA